MNAHSHSSQFRLGTCSHIKPITGAEMKIEINEYDPEWQKVAGQTFTMQNAFFNPHDFAVSKNYYVFFQNAMSFKMVRACSFHLSFEQSNDLANRIHWLVLRVCFTLPNF